MNDLHEARYSHYKNALDQVKYVDYRETASGEKKTDKDKEMNKNTSGGRSF